MRASRMPLSRPVQPGLVLAALLFLSSVLAVAAAGPAHAEAECNSNYDDPDGELAAIAKRVPAFGGFYSDGSALNVWLTDDGESLGAAVEEILSIYGYHDLADLTPTAQPAKYSFMQLFCWHNGPMHEVWTDEVVFTDIDDMKNRLTVAVEDLSAHGPAVRARLAEVGIPLEAVDIIEEGPVMLLPGPVDEALLGPVGNKPLVFVIATGFALAVAVWGAHLATRRRGSSRGHEETIPHASPGD